MTLAGEPSGPRRHPTRYQARYLAYGWGVYVQLGTVSNHLLGEHRQGNQREKPEKQVSPV